MTVSSQKSDQPRKESGNQLPHSKLIANVELTLPTTNDTCAVKTISPCNPSVAMPTTRRVTAAACHRQRGGGTGNRECDASRDDAFDGRIGRSVTRFEPRSFAEFAPRSDRVFHAMLNGDGARILFTVIVVGGHPCLLVMWAVGTMIENSFPRCEATRLSNHHA